MSKQDGLVLDVVSDVVCPWCFVGKRRIERAADLLQQPILIRWHPFELNPQIRREGIPRQEYRIRKFGSPERSKMLEMQLADVGRMVGIDFRFDLMEKTPNTRRAHVLMMLALEQSLETQNRMAERLFTGYFLRGEDPGNPATLMAVAKEIGVESVTDAELFDHPQLQEKVFQSEDGYMRQGVHSVPSMFYKGRLIASGAQPEQILAKALQS